MATYTKIDSISITKLNNAEYTFFMQRVSDQVLIATAKNTNV